MFHKNIMLENRDLSNNGGLIDERLACLQSFETTAANVREEPKTEKNDIILLELALLKDEANAKTKEQRAKQSIHPFSKAWVTAQTCG